MALFSWLTRGLAARPSRERPAGPGSEPQRLLVRKGPAGPTVPPPAIEAGPVLAAVAPPKGERAIAAAEPQKEVPRAVAAGEAVEVPLASILESVPLIFLGGDAEKLVASPEAQKGVVRLPLRRVLAQLPSGRVEFRFADIKAQIPGRFLGEGAEGTESDEVPIQLDLSEIVKRLPSARLERRRDQMDVLPKAEVGVPDLIARPEKKPVEAPLRETARLAMAASSMPIVPGSALGLEAGHKAGTDIAANKLLRIPEAPKKEILLPGEVPEAAPGAEPVSPVQPLFVRKAPPRPGVRVEEGPVKGEVGKAKAPPPKEPDVPKSSGSRMGPAEPPLPMRAATIAQGEGSPGPVPVAGPRALTRPQVPVPSSLLGRPAARVAARPAVSEGERELAAGALARWLGIGPGRDILIREIPGILARMPGVSGAILSDSEALTVARDLPAGISEEAISSSASLLYKRLRHAAKELGGGFTNQTLVGLGQWTLLITCEPPFFLTTVHASHVVPDRLARRIQKIANALARLEKARPVG